MDLSKIVARIMQDDPRSPLKVDRIDHTNAPMVMATKLGEIKKTSLDKFSAVRSSGLIAMDLEPGDELVSVCMATDKDDVILVSQKGQSIRFGVSTLRTA